MTRPITVTCARAFITVPKFYMKALSSHPSPSGLAHGWLRMPYVRQTLYSSDFQPVCRATLVWRELSAGVPRQFGERLKSSEKKLRNKKSSKSMISITLKNNAMIRILDTWILNTILLLVFFSMIKSVLRNLSCTLTSSAPYSACHEMKKVEKLCSTRISAMERFSYFPAPVDDPIGTRIL
jgi:hypothetical protein